jgi:selenocysteine-specific elongation factor
MSAQDERVLSAMLAEYEAAGFAPPPLEGLAVTAQANPQRLAKLAKIAVANRQLFEIEPSLFLAASWENELRNRVRRLIESGGEASVSAIRQELGSTRKYAVPFVEYLDRIGFTKRQGDSRVLGQVSEK